MSTPVNPTVDSFMKNHIPAIRLIIQAMPNKVFDSHEFIKKFSKEFEPDYIEMLCAYKGKGAFQTVHAQIALFLSQNANILAIVKDKIVKTPDIFGDPCTNQSWKK